MIWLIFTEHFVSGKEAYQYWTAFCDSACIFYVFCTTTVLYLFTFTHHFHLMRERISNQRRYRMDKGIDQRPVPLRVSQ